VVSAVVELVLLSALESRLKGLLGIAPPYPDGGTLNIFEVEAS